MDFSDVRKPLPDRAAVLAMAELSALAYVPFPENALPDLNVSGVSKDGVEVLLVSDDEYLAITFRGTDLTWREWMRNLTAVPAEDAGGMYHKGYYEAIDAIFEELTQSLEEHHGIDTGPSAKWKKIVISGHSQGGALAGMLLSARLPAKHVQSVCVFNAPLFAGIPECRMLQRRLSNAGNGKQGTRYLRVSYGNDIIGYVPVFFRRSDFPLLPTRHRFGVVGDFAHLGKDGTLVVNPSRGRFIRRWLADLRKGLLRNHGIENTVKALKNG